MAQNWVGCVVSIECTNSQGTYQGVVSEIDGESQSLILTKVFKNGTPYSQPTYELRAKDIQDLKIIEEAKPAGSPLSSSTVLVRKPMPRRMHKTVSEDLATSKNSRPGGSNESDSDYQFSPGMNNNKKDKLRQRYPARNWVDRNEAAFGAPIDHHAMNKDFDFEKNLALFNKKTSEQEFMNRKLLNAQRPDLVRHAESSSANYRNDENVISNSAPTKYRQILVENSSKEYSTDADLIIPSITYQLRKKIFDLAEEIGLSLERQIEMMGRAACELALQILGGPYRLNPANSHQWPQVVILCGANRPGAVGINCGRHLASHGLKVVLYLVEAAKYVTYTAHELSLFKLTDNEVIHTVNELPRSNVDLVIVALADESTTRLQNGITSWANYSRVPLLAIDPPTNGTPDLVTRYSIVPVLPLAYSRDNGKIFLSNIGMPQQVFKKLGIRYRSPFGHKTVIALHENETVD